MIKHAIAHLQDLCEQARHLVDAGAVTQPAGQDLLAQLTTLSEMLANAQAEHAAVQAALAAERARLEAVIDQLPIGVIILDLASTQITHYNAQAEQLLGHPLVPTSELASFANYRGIHPDGRPYAPSDYPMAQAIAGQAVREQEVQYLRDTALPIILSVSAFPIQTQGDQPDLAVCTFTDITAQKQVALERSRLLEQVRAAHLQTERERATLHALLMQAPAAICILSGPSFIFTFINPRCIQLMGRSDVLGQTLEQALPELASQGFVALVDQVYRTGEPVVGDEVLVRLDRHGTGVLTDAFVNFLYAAIKQHDGTSTDIFVHAVDVTDLVAARQAAHAAVQIRDQFLSVAAHELKTPLTALLGFTQLLERRMTRTATADPQTLRTLAQIITLAQRQTTLIDTLMDVARLNLGRLSVEREPLDVSALVDRIVEDLRPSLNRHTLVLEDHSFPLLTFGDSVRLEQVITNLLQNAVKYSPDGGAITVTLQATASEVSIAIRDQGIGIPAAALPHLFERFYRVERASTQQISGMGIGLSVVQELVMLHDGRIEVTSIEDVGSTFTVCLPRLATV